MASLVGYQTNAASSLEASEVATSFLSYDLNAVYQNKLGSNVFLTFSGNASQAVFLQSSPESYIAAEAEAEKRKDRQSGSIGMLMAYRSYRAREDLDSTDGSVFFRPVLRYRYQWKHPLSIMYFVEGSDQGMASGRTWRHSFSASIQYQAGSRGLLEAKAGITQGTTRNYYELFVSPMGIWLWDEYTSFSGLFYALRRFTQRGAAGDPPAVLPLKGTVSLLFSADRALSERLEISAEYGVFGYFSDSEKHAYSSHSIAIGLRWFYHWL